MMEYEKMFSERGKKMKKSEIWSILSMIPLRNIISFAGGLPDSKIFPTDTIKEISNNLLDTDNENVMQYGSTEGLNKLRDEIVDRMNKRGMNIKRENLLITHGSMQGLDLIAKIFINPGDKIMIGAPTYGGAISSFRSLEAEFETIPIKSEGIDLDDLENKLENCETKPKFLYVMPSYQNPTGLTIPDKNRKRLLDIASEHDILLIEDTPYDYLRYDGEPYSDLLALDDEDRVLHLESFSKVLAPGFRIGWAAGPTEMIDKMVIAKQASDLCTNSFGQYIAYEYLTKGYFEEHLETIRKVYREKRDKMLESMERYFPEDVQWTRPDGGLFLWVILPYNIDADEMLKSALRAGVAYVEGAAFYPGKGGSNCLRLNFTHPSLEEINKGIKILGEVIEDKIEQERTKKKARGLITP